MVEENQIPPKRREHRAPQAGGECRLQIHVALLKFDCGLEILSCVGMEADQGLASRIQEGSAGPTLVEPFPIEGGPVKELQFPVPQGVGVEGGQVRRAARLTQGHDRVQDAQVFQGPDPFGRPDASQGVLVIQEGERGKDSIAPE